MTLIGRKKLYRRGFVLPHPSGKDFSAHPGQGNAKNGLLMRMLWNFGLRGIDAFNQSQSSELAGSDDLAAKFLLSAWFHHLITIRVSGLTAGDAATEWTNVQRGAYCVSVRCSSEGILEACGMRLFALVLHVDSSRDSGAPRPEGCTASQPASRC